jgi:hypothetical protein
MSAGEDVNGEDAGCITERGGFVCLVVGKKTSEVVDTGGFYWLREMAYKR